MAAQSGNPECPFCQLIANPEQTFDVHETEHFKAWLDINPRAYGHTMVVPKEHLNSMEDIGEHAAELFELIRIVMEKAKNGLGADGVSVALNEGEAAGQKLDHFYAQVFPRFEDDENAGAPTGAVFQYREDLDENDLPEISEKMESADFSSVDNNISGPASNIISTNRGNGQQENTEEQHDTSDNEESSENSQEAEDKSEEEKKQRNTWDGDSYSWGHDRAEFK